MTDVTSQYRVVLCSRNATTEFPDHEVSKVALLCGLNLESNLLNDTKKCSVKQLNLHEE